MRIKAAQRIKGRIRLPGDKSISHRAALIAALATGNSQISNFSTSQDCSATLECLRTLGVSIHREGGNVLVEGAGALGLRAPRNELDCENSGSTMRMLAGVVAGQSFTSTLTGDDSLRSRPMIRIIEPLERMGARVLSQDGKPPLAIKGTRSLRPISYDLPVASAQVKSCVLLAGLQAQGTTEAIETLGATRDHTERMLRWFGAPIEISQLGNNGATRTAVSGPVTLSARDIVVPGDISSAAFLVAAAALLPGSDLEIDDVGLNPTRTEFLSTLSTFGVDLETTAQREESNEPTGTVRVKGGITRSSLSEKPNAVAGPLIPQLIDELPLLAVVGTQIPGGIHIHDAGELRLKESDRIRLTVKNLRVMGAEVEEFSDGLRVAGPTKLRGAMIDPSGDHRIAMAFAVAALMAEGESQIQGAECIGVSFPEFFTLLDSVTER